MRAKQLILLLPLILFSNCKKEERQPPELPKAESEIMFRIPASPENWFRDGAVYKDTYLVWAQDTSFNRMLICYDLVNKEKLWEYDFNGVPGWGNRMAIYNDVLVADRLDFGISLFDLSERQIVVKFRFDSTPNFTSSTGPTFYDDKIYKTVLQPYEGLAKILSFDLENGAIISEYEWDSSSNSKEFLTTPLVYYNDNTQQVNLTMLLQLSNFNSAPIKFKETYLINVSEDNTLNWIDTIGNRGSSTSLPIIVGDDIIVKCSDLMISYNKNTGIRNWTKTVGIGGDEKLLNIDGNIYLNSFSLSKINKTDGHFIWSQRSLGSPSMWGDFEVVNNRLVYVPMSFGNLMSLDNQTGEFIYIVDDGLEGIANPKYYKEQNIFVTHTKNEVIGFIIK